MAGDQVSRLKLIRLWQLPAYRPARPLWMLWPEPTAIPDPRPKPQVDDTSGDWRINVCDDPESASLWSDFQTRAGATT